MNEAEKANENKVDDKRLYVQKGLTIDNVESETKKDWGYPVGQKVPRTNTGPAKLYPKQQSTLRVRPDISTAMGRQFSLTRNQMNPLQE